MQKLGLDYHGVITANPMLFSFLSKILRYLNYEVHIITGRRITESLKIQLSEYGISYSHLFSISDYHFKIGTPMTGYEDNQPKIDDEIWNKTKGEYCRTYKIDLHIDDSHVYGNYFSTPYLLFKQWTIGEEKGESIPAGNPILDFLPVNNSNATTQLIDANLKGIWGEKELLEVEPAFVNSRCAVCGEQQFDTEGGLTCTNGHGGAISIPFDLQKESRPLAPEFMDVVNKKLPDLLG